MRTEQEIQEEVLRLRSMTRLPPPSENSRQLSIQTLRWVLEDPPTKTREQVEDHLEYYLSYSGDYFAGFKEALRWVLNR